MPGMPPPRRKMISSANLWAISARRVLGGDVRVLLAQHLRRGRVLDVIQPALHRDLARGRAQVAERQHGGIGRRNVPQPESHLGGFARNLQRIEALGNQFDHAGVVQVVPERVVEGLEQRGVLRVAGGRLEIGNRKPDLLHPEARCPSYPILGTSVGTKARAERKNAGQPKTGGLIAQRLVCRSRPSVLRRAASARKRILHTTISYPDMFCLASCFPRAR